MLIGVMGTGYVGLVTGAVFAELGNTVTCCDIDASRIERLNRGEMPIYEPGLQEMVRRNMEDDRIFFTQDASAAVRTSEILFICVGTPPSKTGETDLSQVKAAARAIGRNMNGYKIVVNKSTVPVGTGDLVRETIEKIKPKNVGLDVVSNPEFLAEGTAIQDALHPERIVIGAPNKQVAMKLIELYSTLEKPMVITSVRSAEMIKYASNSFLATKISFVNSIANLCEGVGADIEEVVRGMGLDSRIGGKFLRAGVGYGGSCFPKDTESLLYVSKKFKSTISILEDTIRVNKGQPDRFIRNVEKLAGGRLAGKTVAALGLAFKPGTDDLRDSASIDVIRKLLKMGARVRAYDPVAMDKCRSVLPGIEYCEDEYEAAKGADVLLLLTEWNRFKQLDFNKLGGAMKRRLIADGRNIYDPHVLNRYGFKYYGVGRSWTNAPAAPSKRRKKKN